jgi:hypothetical protein
MIPFKINMKQRSAKLRKVLQFILNAIWAIPAVLLIRVVRPWMRVRMDLVCHNRIGTSSQTHAFTWLTYL